MTMKPYIHPRIGGVTRTSVFIKGFGRYLKDCGYEAEFMTCPGESSLQDAIGFVRKALDRNLPIACLLLRHREPAFKNISWHWFMITGYAIKNGRFFVTYHTYGRVHSVDFEKLWDTGMRRKGGMAALGEIVKSR